MKRYPKHSSKPEETFFTFLETESIAEPTREYVFAKPRKWRFDFAWPTKKVAVEIDGIGFSSYRITRHQTGPGFLKDREKDLAAKELGWNVVHVPAPWVTRQEHKRLIDRVLEYIRERVGNRGAA